MTSYDWSESIILFLKNLKKPKEGTPRRKKKEEKLE